MLAAGKLVGRFQAGQIGLLPGRPGDRQAFRGMGDQRANRIAGLLEPLNGGAQQDGTRVGKAQGQ
jgi:hypothetical protein